jgi:hypothetical protein
MRLGSCAGLRGQALICSSGGSTNDERSRSKSSSGAKRQLWMEGCYTVLAPPYQNKSQYRKGGQSTAKTRERRAGNDEGGVDAIDGGHGREKGGGGEEGVRVRHARRTRGRRRRRRGGGRWRAKACGGVQATNQAHEGGVDVLGEAAKAPNLEGGEGRHAKGLGVAHSTRSAGGVEERGAFREEVQGGVPGGGAGGRLETRRGGEGELGDVSHDGGSNPRTCHFSRRASKH